MIWGGRGCSQNILLQNDPWHLHGFKAYQAYAVFLIYQVYYSTSV